MTNILEKIKFCPYCGTNLNNKRDYFLCPKCKEKFFKNFVYVGVGAIFVENGKVLLAKRAREPHKGGYDIIGGFLEVGELPEDGIVREVKEETDLDIEIVNLFGIYRDIYGKNNEPTLNIHYICKVIGGKPKPQDDITELRWFTLEETEKIITFKNVQEALKDLRRKYKKNKKLFD